MKKLFLCSAVVLTAITGTAATVEWTGHCGETVITIGEDYFEDKAEAEEYYHELNLIFCGSDGDYDTRTDTPTPTNTGTTVKK